MAITQAPPTGDFGDIMKQARLDAGYDRQEDAAPDLGVRQQTVSKWENGNSPDPKLWVKIEEVYGLEPGKIYGWLVATDHPSVRSSWNLQTLSDLLLHSGANDLTPLAA